MTNKYTQTCTKNYKYKYKGMLYFRKTSVDPLCVWVSLAVFLFLMFVEIIVLGTQNLDF